MAPTFATQQTAADNRKLVRKVQRAIGCLAPTSVELPESLYGSGTSLIDLKTLGFFFIGLVSPDGYTFSGERETEDVDALGYASPVRTDTTRMPRSVTVTALEKGKRSMEELIRGVDLSSVTQSPTTGEVVFDEADLPADKEYRLLVIGQDGPADEEWIMGKGYGSVKLTNSGDETWGQEGAIQSELTFNVFTDDEIGSPVRHYLGGTGALKFKDVLGYTAGV